MRQRKRGYGNKNICGANIERIRKAQGMKLIMLVSKMQLLGVSIDDLVAEPEADP